MNKQIISKERTQYLKNKKYKQYISRISYNMGSTS
jgi:hypothetical protein